MKYTVNNTKNVLILSESHDTISDLVCSWLSHKKKKYKRLNVSQNIKIKEVFISNKEVKISFFSDSNEVLYLSDFDSIWCRRGLFSFSLPDPNRLRVEPDLQSTIDRHLRNEIDTLKEFVYWEFEKKRCINSPNLYNVNKLKALRYAQEVGLCIPRTFVSESFEGVSEELNSSEIITKNIQDILFFIDDKNQIQLAQSTRDVDEEVKPNNFFYSLFQNKIQKKYELRIFFIEETFSSVAIFSQGDKDSETDFRLTNLDKPSRIVPYQLPLFIEEKLKTLLTNLNLNSGSIDMIVSDDGEYYFLEVNPVGQFAWVNSYCNLYLEKEIFNSLTNET